MFNNRLRIAMAQINLYVGALSKNTDAIIAWSNLARDEHKADVVIFPELTLTGYPPDDLLLREDLYTRISSCLNRLKQEIKGVCIIIGYPEKTENGVYNSAVCIANGHVIANYRKQHLPNYSVFDEERYFKKGCDAVVVDIKSVPIGITICEDIWMANPASQCSLNGAKIIVNLNASPYSYEKQTLRENIVLNRVTETGIPILYVNLIGGQDELVFDGTSFVMDASGYITHKAESFKETLLLVDYDCVTNSIKLPPANKKIEPGTVQFSISEVYQALVLGTRDYINKNGFVGCVIGLSGGIDSALTLTIAVDAIGKNRVEAIMMPSRYTAKMSLDDAHEEARLLGVEYKIISVESVFESFLHLLRYEFQNTQTDVTEENIQARCRGVILMAISNKKGKIVLTTGNKSEMAVGYATLYGDMAGGFAVLKDVPKTLVYQLALYRNQIGAVIPQRVIDRPPSAELSENQKDEDSLPAYAILDSILEMYIERDLSIAEIVKSGFDADVVNHIINLVDKNEYKRRQAAPGIRITKKSFGRDRRFPLTSGYVHERSKFG